MDYLYNFLRLNNQANVQNNLVGQPVNNRGNIPAGNLGNPNNRANIQNHLVGLPVNNHGNIAAVNPGNPNNRGNNHDIRPRNQGNRGENNGVRGGNHDNRGGNHGNRDGNHGNRGGNHGNRGGNQGNRGGNQGNRGGNHGNRGNRGGNRGNQGGNHANWRGDNRGQRNEHGGQGRHRNPNPRPEMPNMDWFNMRPRDVSEDRRSQASQRSYQGNAPLRRDYGGRYGSTASLNQDEPRRWNNDQEHNHRGRGRGGRPYARSGMGFKRLEDMCATEPDKLVLSLSNENAGLEKLFSQDMSNDYIVLILRVITRLCESAFDQNKATILATVCDEQFIAKLNLYLADIILHELPDKRKNKYFWDEQERFWNDLLTVYENILKIIPNRACDVLPKLVKRTCLSVIDIEREQHCTVPDEIKVRLEELQQKLLWSVEEREKKQQTNKLMPQNDEEPPDDFRQISLYPTVYEITNNHEQVFLRQNIVEGKYNSVDHYLDVQFRLLREDFVAPLRDGICNFLDQMKTRDHQRIFNVRIYKDVRFVKKHTIQDKVVVVIQLPATKRKIKLENSRRFMFGSLVCFTNDNFRTIIFGTVAGRDKDLMANGQIAVDVLDNVDFTVPYVMIECSVFFEPYYHVLKALQIMTEDRFPLKRYIIDVEPDVRPPAYYDMLSVIEHQNYRFYPLNANSWPSYNQLGLDQSQFRAFHAALTHEFSVIQGPPGTGKTYIGLKVAQVLLENREHWNESGSPILVICFTNHALDQFLEGILRFTSKLIRIGGQSKSEKLKGFNIREMRNKGIRSRTRDSAMLLTKRRAELKEYMNKIHGHTTLLDAINGCEGIINFKNLGVIDDQVPNSWFSRATPNELMDWLLGGRNPDERYEERRRNRLAQLQARLEKEENENRDNDSDDDDFFDAEVEDERLVDDEDEIVIISECINQKTFILKSCTDYENAIKQLEGEIVVLEMKYEETNEVRIFDEREMKADQLDKIINDLDYLKYRLDQFKSNNPPPKPRLVDYANPLILTPNERWGLYFHWLQLYRTQLMADLAVLDEKYRQVYRQYEEVRLIEDTKVMREMLVIGMTTSGAARYQSLLQALKCSIVIVEEAAEVLESHVVVSLTNHCQHLILIGDHQQLRPTTAEYRIAKKYNLEISLFERMVKNNIHCVQLEVQHRMRPEIARLIVPAIYPKLDNHYDVEIYPPVQGVTKNLFFITHTEPEEDMSDTGSKRNIHEAKFLIRLARHLILQGYEPHEITILATYSGQMFCLWKERKLFDMLKDVRITVVDNFQGEECKIILLSLVRSNEKDIVGFLKIENRVCVALSRAKEGMFIMGNMKILEKSSDVWRQIKNVFDTNDQLDTHLTLQCQVHPDQLTRVAKAEDFNKVIEGGCSRLCNKELNCGHVCTSLCHITDRQHAEYKCKEKCLKVLCELDHPCPDRCFEECKPCMVPMLVTLKCAHSHHLPCHMQDTTQYKCPTLVEVVLEDCEHRANKPCHKDIKTFACPHICDIRIRSCGHACTMNCHVRKDPDHLEVKCFKQCERTKKNCSLGTHMCPLRCHEECQPCETIVNKKRSCGHMHKVQCSFDVEEIECKKRCIKTLDCGHKCKQPCGDPCGNCNEKVTKTIPECNHKVKMICSQPPDRSKCNGKCPRLLSCGHPCDKKCNEKCQTKCSYLMDNPHRAACGHQFQIPCYKTKINLEATQYRLLKHCTAPCEETLLCTHRCSGTCGTCAQGRVHVTCQEQCGNVLVCGHQCAIPCREMCQPCTKRCSFRCTHSKCGQNCGEPCRSCTEPCTRRCMHKRCSKRCGQICDVEPCTEPCPLLLKCRHPCIGFCGDPCPPVCRVCDKDDGTFVIMFGNEDEPDARFVYLEECKHVIEAEAMDNWMNQVDEGENKTINVKHCPKCKTTLALTQRYADIIKGAYADINRVKVQWFGQEQQNAESRLQLQIRIAQVKNINKTLYLQSKFLKPALQELQSVLQSISKGKRNPVNIMLINKCSAQVELLEKIIRIYDKGDFSRHPQINDSCLECIDFLFSFMQASKCRFTDQEIADISLEAKRFEKIVQLLTIEKSPYFINAIAKPAIYRLKENIKYSLCSVKKYSESEDTKNRENLKTLGEAVDKSIKLEEQELKMIVSAMKMDVGQWYKCPNGHLYAIGNCGGAVISSKCNECNAVIGGSHHTSAAGNRPVHIESSLLQPRLHDLQNILKEKHKGKRNPLNIITIISVTSEIGLIESLVNVFTKGKLDNTEKLYKASVERLDNILDMMHEKNKHISKQRASDIEVEINRFERFIQLCTVEKHPNFNAAVSNSQVKTIYNNILTEINSLKVYSDNTDKFLKISLEKLADAVDKTMTITDEERRSIVKAMSEGRDGLGKGRWFKCPNGHVFAIGECGGAMEVGKCNECGSQIGGQNHALLSTNRFAGEMDGASHPAWSNAANMDMRNFQFDF